MESLKIIPKNQHRKNKSLIYKYCDLSFYKKRENPEKNDKIDYDTTSLKSKNTQSVSTGPEEKVENTYKRSLNKNLFNGSKTNYSSHTHNISDNSHRLYSSSNYSNSIGFRNKNRGSMSSKKKKFSYHQIIKTLSMNSDNNLQSKAII